MANTCNQSHASRQHHLSFVSKKTWVRLLIGGWQLADVTVKPLVEQPGKRDTGFFNLANRRTGLERQAGFFDNAGNQQTVIARRVNSAWCQILQVFRGAGIGFDVDSTLRPGHVGKVGALA